MATGAMPDVSMISNGTIGTSVVFGNADNFRKRPIETLDDDWTNGNVAGVGPSASITAMGNIDPNLAHPTTVNVDAANGQAVNGMVAAMANGLAGVPPVMPATMQPTLQPGAGQTIDPGIVAPGAGGIGLGVGVGLGVGSVGMGMSNGSSSSSGRSTKRAKKV